MTKTCKTCRHLAVVPDRAGRRVVRARYVYRCTAPLPDLRAILPASMAGYIDRAKLHASRGYMRGSDGADCPTHEPVERPQT